MKFIYADALDFVDPNFDFATESNGLKRNVHHDDEYPHEFLGKAPYDGILVSRGVVGDVLRQGKYTLAQMMRFRREGARRFLRYSEADYPDSLVFGDCGAFTYRNERVPPYTPSDTLEFYADGGFTHGCSVDHIIFDFDEGKGRSREEVPRETLERYELTLQLASEFHSASKLLPDFTPMGVVQGWSATSMAWAASQLVRMGYDYLAVGGLVPLKIPQIHAALSAIRSAIPPRVKLHLLGFGKIESLPEFEDYGVASFDTTSPLLRAFKDAEKNYFARDPAGGLRYYTAIRIPQALENNRLKSKARSGSLNQEEIVSLEESALHALRQSAINAMPVEDALDRIIAYWKALNWESDGKVPRLERTITKQRDVYRRTLSNQPWAECDCRVCREGGVEALLFRSSNRNKRRGIHNLYVFYQHLLEQRNAA